MTARKINASRDGVTGSYPDVTPVRRICRTVAETAQAGWDDGANDPPLTPDQVTRLAALLGPYLRPDAASVEDASTRRSA